MLRVTTVNKAATTMWDYHHTTFSLGCRCVAEGLFLVFGCDFAGVHLAWAMHPQTRETSKLCMDE
jgi:hypothetical protein